MRGGDISNQFSKIDSRSLVPPSPPPPPLLVHFGADSINSKVSFGLAFSIKNLRS